MTEGKTFFARVFDAMLESRMRQADTHVAAYRKSHQIDAPKTGL